MQHENFNNFSVAVRGLIRVWVNWSAGPIDRELHFPMGEFWERSPLGSRFSTSLFRDVPETVLSSVRTRGFKKNSSNLNRPPKIRDSVLLNSWDIFVVILPSISSETCVMSSSVIPGTNMHCDWPFVGCSCVSLKLLPTFAGFLMLPSLGEKMFNNSEDWIILYFNNQFRRKTKSVFSIWSIVTISTVNWLSKWEKSLLIKVLSFLLFIPLPWWET